jgi:hypothetical protein
MESIVLNQNQPINPLVFEFEGNGLTTKEIAISDLAQSIRRESGLAGIRNIDIQYWKFYASILSMVNDANFNYAEQPIFVQNNSSKALLTDADKLLGYNQKLAPVSKWRFDKVLSIINIPNIITGQSSDMARNAAIGLTLNKEGLTVAFGMNLHICSNFNVLGGTVMHSYGSANRDATPWDIMKIRLEQWIKNLNQIWKVQNEIMQEMIQYELPMNSVVEEVVGDLYYGAIKQAYFKGPNVPFNTNELSDFVQESIRQKKKEDKLSTLWDLYNWGTAIMKPGMFDIGEIANNSNIWSEYLIDKFALKSPKNIIEILIPE